MSNLFKMYKTDENYEKNGIFVQLGTTDDGRPINFRIARAGGQNTRYLKVLEIKTKPYKRQIQNDLIDLKLTDEIMMDVFAECIVLGWENVEDETGKPIQFTKENCIALFKQLPDLFAEIREQATKVALFRTEILEKDAKNS